MKGGVLLSCSKQSIKVMLTLYSLSTIEIGQHHHHHHKERWRKTYKVKYNNCYYALFIAPSSQKALPLPCCVFLSAGIYVGGDGYDDSESEQHPNIQP